MMRAVLQTHLLCLTTVLLSTLPALGHVRMTSPTPRYAETSNADADIKEPPCGRTNGTRTKDAARITTFRPGETIKIAFKETIDHDGYFRVAFDDDGQNA